MFFLFNDLKNISDDESMLTKRRIVSDLYKIIQIKDKEISLAFKRAKKDKNSKFSMKKIL